MAMSISDPCVLLDAMTTMLGEYGDIKGPQEVVTVISLMKDAEKLLSRYTFLNILRATVQVAANNTVALETVNQFVKDGGCAILNKWLADAKGLENLPLILEVLEILEAMPITVKALKQAGNIGKLVKQLTKSEEKDIKELSSNLLNKWMILVKGKPKKSKKSDEQSEDPNSAGSPTMKRTRDHAAVGKTNQPPEKKSKSLAEAKSSVTSVAKPPPKAKVIQALPKPIVMESLGFMNALIQQTAPAAGTKKKKKVAPPPSPKATQSYSGPLEEILQKQTQTHMQGDEKEKGSKQKEKGKQEEEQKEEEKETGNSDSQERSQEINMQNKNKIEEPTVLEESNINPSETEPSSAAGSCEGASTEGEAKPNTTDAVEPMETGLNVVELTSEGAEQDASKRKKKKKSIKWAEDDKLLVYHYYEPDEEEIVNVQHVVNFHDAQHQEAMRERQRVEQAKRLSEDKMVEKIVWYRPGLLQVSELMEHGVKSEEKLLQKYRESKILAHLFFSKSSLPTSPDEPEPEANTGSASSQPLIIPHDEKGTVYPPSKGAPLSQPPPEVIPTAAVAGVALPPALASLLANASGKVPGGSPSNSAGVNNPAMTNVDVQALLKKLMGSQEQGEQGTLEDTAERMRNELNNPRFPSPLMSQQLRVPGRVPVDQGSRGVPMEPRSLPEYRPRGLLRTPRPDRARFPGPHRGGPPRGRFHPPGGPRLRHPMPGQRMPAMGRGGMPNRFPGPDGNRDPGDDFYNDQYNFNEGEKPEGHGRGMPPRGRGARGRGRGRPMCRHFMSPRGCLRGNSCTFLHPGTNRPPV